MMYCTECGNVVVDYDKQESWVTWRKCDHCALLFKVNHQDRMGGCVQDPVIEVIFRGTEWDRAFTIAADKGKE